MRFLKKLFGRRPNDADEVLNSICGGVTSSVGAADTFEAGEYELMRIARQRKGHLSRKAVCDEYNRLVGDRNSRRWKRVR
jgi:hypothetical protein